MFILELRGTLSVLEAVLQNPDLVMHVIKESFSLKNTVHSIYYGAHLPEPPPGGAGPPAPAVMRKPPSRRRETPPALQHRRPLPPAPQYQRRKGRKQLW